MTGALTASFTRRRGRADQTGLTRAEEAVAILGPQPHLEQSGKIIIARLDPASFATPDLPGIARGRGFQLAERHSRSHRHDPHPPAGPRVPMA
ncbi:hypothetical protein [Parafrankia sp. EUN1f]|uniref:hypothetical protein n=1 Tax=Parafrankia sp. EUN1f TaxID=102897 RepID=UPI0001C467A7|nr:hypothetical protein [Parafrankia sp. EUN1f]EFC81143.1 hypothetical protein FrEUN1fDRAFT_5722 [Parafrankia sp. EUN1f]